jgi:hypothetical protein
VASITFEDIFRDFVIDFGGEIIPERQETRSADFLFRPYNIIAELKCLEVDQTDTTHKRFLELTAKHAIDTNSTPLLPDQGFMRDFQAVLLGPIESVIRDANRQIRSTKEFLGLPDALGIVLIFNSSNPLHASSPQHYARLVGEVIQKPKDEARRFPHIDGMIYFSYHVTTFDEETQTHMPFWHPTQVRGESVQKIKRFQDDLKLAWYAHIEQMSGATVVPHHRETGWPD